MHNLAGYPTNIAGVELYPDRVVQLGRVVFLPGERQPVSGAPTLRPLRSPRAW